MFRPVAVYVFCSIMKLCTLFHTVILEKNSTQTNTLKTVNSSIFYILKTAEEQILTLSEKHNGVYLLKTEKKTRSRTVQHLCIFLE